MGRVVNMGKAVNRHRQSFDALIDGNVRSLGKYGWVYMRDGSIYCEDADYLISFDRIKEGSWVSHLLEKNWFDANKFLPIYFYALRRGGMSEITVDTYGLGAKFLCTSEVREAD